MPEAAMPESGSGRCLCGAIRYEWTAKPLWTGHCHCESCRRNCAAPFTSFFGVAHGAWRWTGEKPQLYRSSPGNRRWFCAQCGTPMAYESDRFLEEIHFYAAGMEDPSLYRADVNFHFDEHLPWALTAGDVPPPGASHD